MTTHTPSASLASHIDHLDHDRRAALISVVKELQRQQEKWGEQNHGLDRWTIIELEEIGEVAQESLKMREDPDGKDDHFEQLLQEWAEVAAVAITAIASLLRQSARSEL